MFCVYNSNPLNNTSNKISPAPLNSAVTEMESNNNICSVHVYNLDCTEKNTP